MKIKTKREFYELSHAGLLGNTVRQWEYEEFLISQFCGPVAVRHKEPGSPWCRYDLAPEDAAIYVEELVDCNGARYEDFQISEHSPDHLVTVQGEVMRSHRGLELQYAWRSGKRMRQSLSLPRATVLKTDWKIIHVDTAYPLLHVYDSHGAEAALLLRWFMDGQSRDFLDEIWDRYPDSVVEFACYEKPVGLLGWNTLFWEVRDY